MDKYRRSVNVILSTIDRKCCKIGTLIIVEVFGYKIFKSSCFGLNEFGAAFDDEKLLKCYFLLALSFKNSDALNENKYAFIDLFRRKNDSYSDTLEIVCNLIFYFFF